MSELRPEVWAVLAVAFSCIATGILRLGLMPLRRANWLSFAVGGGLVAVGVLILALGMAFLA